MILVFPVLKPNLLIVSHSFVYCRLPDVYTQFRKQVEGGCKVRQPIEMPAQLNPLPPGIEEGEIPSSQQLGVKGKTKRLFYK